MDLRKIGFRGLDFINLAQDRDTVIQTSDSIKDGYFLDQLKVLSASQAGLCSLEFVSYYSTRA
jgi:hypothetical protein